MSTTRRERFVEAVRSLIGTPYAHQGRTPGLALDCIGVPMAAAAMIGFEHEDVAGYGPMAQGVRFVSELHARCKRITLAAAVPGDLLIMAWTSEPQHVAVLTAPNVIVHAHIAARRTVEHPLDEAWLSRVRGVYRIIGLDE